MKYRITIFLTLFCFFCKAQESKSKIIKFSFVDKKQLGFGPFDDFNVGESYGIVTTDTTMLISFHPFRILNRSKDGVKFLILSDFYDRFAMLNMQNGFGYMYLVDLGDKKLNLYICNGYSYKMSRKHIDMNIDTITNKVLVMKGQ